MKENILIINVCKEKLHELEFVKPICDVLEKNKINYFVNHYLSLNKKDLDKCSRVIICGTSLQDDCFLKDVKLFRWIRNFDKPVLGICAGMQIIGKVYGENINKKIEIGFFKEAFRRKFLGLKGEQEVWHLHNNYVVSWNSDWDVVCEGNGIVQAVKHKKRKVYGVLFHPEVRQKEMILEFVNG